MNPNEILKQIEASECNKVKVAIADIDGVLRGKYMSKEKFLSAAKSGFGFCNVVFGWDIQDECYDAKTGFTGWHTAYPDSIAQIDLRTIRYVPWENNVPFFLADFVDSKGDPLSVCPRQLLRRAIGFLDELGYTALVGVEYEWFNFAETSRSLYEKNFLSPVPISPGMFGYSLLRMASGNPYFQDLMNHLHSFKIPLEGLHTETGPGVYEAAIAAADPLEAGDRAVIAKTAIKEIALHHGIIASFMARWNHTLPGSGGHIHQSLLSKSTGEPVFYSPNSKNGMSSIFESYLAGLLHLLPEVLPFFAPSINSYKRLVEGFWAPTHPTWGIDNRTTAFRVIPGSPASTRLETRVSGADVNPYLGIAASLICGAYGIKNGLKLTKPATVGSAYGLNPEERLPRNLFEATRALSQSSRARELFGAGFIEHLVKTRHWEWHKYQNAVTDWELRRYFELT